MPRVVGIRFKKVPKVYYFEAGEHEYSENGGVIVETARGVEYGTVAMLPADLEDDKIVQPLKPIIRIADEKDEKRVAEIDARRDETFAKCSEIIGLSGLNMKLVDIEYTFDNSKLIVHFSSDGRVDFRELVKKLAGAFRTRIELRQIGARDECRLVGGLGHCGRVCCCKGHLNDYTKVSIKMAKNQNLSLNPQKISGLCGRLMCCLEYENPHYVETNKRMPRINSQVKTADGREGVVIGLNQLKETVKLKINEKDNSFSFGDVNLADIVAKGKGSNLDEVETDEDVDIELKELE